MEPDSQSPEAELESLFHQAAALPGRARETFLDEACSNRTELRKALERLLSANDSDTSLTPASPPEGRMTGEVKIGDPIGRYRLLERIGEGGWGVVFMAEQTEPIRRRVALKVIKAGMDSRAVIARFEAERQALALMDHPNIARVLDAGTTEQGRPYFVMELVRGRRITDHCDHFKLSTRARLELLAPVCQAVQHAHQKGIIHRDLKPSNILVSVDDGVAIPKVIDFGIAKATEQPLTEKTLVTGFHQLLGTPAYMSPEQAEFCNLDIDTRSDIYSLGVLLYELLTGDKPFDNARLLQQGLDEIRRIIREVEPPRPSTRVATLPDARRTTVAANRGLDVPALERELAGDLDWIVMKCVEKDRSRRYQTAMALAQDLSRYLHHEPVQARPPSATYRLRKLVRRHRVATVALTSIFLAILAGLALTGWQWRRAEQSRASAERSSYAGQLGMAEQLIQNGDVLAAREVLLGLPESLRGWEWGRLLLLAHQDLATVPFTNVVLKLSLPDHARSVPDPTLSEDGARLVILGDGVAQVVTVRDGKTVQTFGDPTKRISQARFSPDGTLLLLAGTEMGWELRDVSTWEKIRSSDRRPIQTADFRPDGRQFVTGDGGTNIVLWEVTTGAPVREVTAPHAVPSVMFSRDGRRLFSPSGGPRQSQFIWDSDTGGIIAQIPPHPEKYVRLSIANTGDRYATADTNGVAAYWRVGQALPDFETPRLSPDPQAIFAVEASPNLPRLAVIRAPGQLRLWDCERGAELRPTDGFTYSMWSAPDGKTLLTGSQGMHLRVWDWNTGEEEYRILGGHGGMGTRTTFTRNARFVAISSSMTMAGAPVQVFALRPPDLRLSDPSQAFRVALSPDGNRAAMTHVFRGLSIWDANTGETLGFLNGHFRWVSDVFWSADGKRLYSGSADKTVRVWDAETLRELRRFTNATAPIHGIAVSPDERLLAASDNSGWTHVWDLPEGTLRWSWQVYTNAPGAPMGAAWPLRFNRTGDWLVLGAYHGQAGVWDVKAKRRVLQFAPGDGIADYIIAASWTPDDSQLVTCDFSRRIRFWETGSWRLLRTIQIGRGGALEFSPAGDRLFVSTSESGMSDRGETGVDVYDPRHWQLLVRLGRRQGNTLSLRFSADGTRVARGLWANAVNGYGTNIWDTLPWHDRDFPGDREEPLAARIARFARDRIWQSLDRDSSQPAAEIPGQTWIPPRSEWPARSPDTPPACMDLTAYYNARLDVAWEYSGFWDRNENHLADLPQGVVRLDGVTWDIRGVVSLGRPEPLKMSTRNYWPAVEQVSGIRIESKCSRLHFLHAAMDLWEECPWVGRYRLNYADGTTHDLVLRPGIDIGNWWAEGDWGQATAGSKAWEGSNAITQGEPCHTVLYHRAWDNPHPEKEILSLDFITAGGLAVPILIAITLDP